jgi:hypothetical protein
MDGTILGQGSFTTLGTNAASGTVATGIANIIQIPSGADWVSVRNFTQYGTAGNSAVVWQGTTANSGFEYFWQRGMAPGTALVKYKTSGAAGINADTLLTGGFTLYDPSGSTAGAQPIIGPAVATTASTNATRPVVSTASTAGISVGTVVRMSNTAQSDVNGIDMVVGAVTLNTSFTLLTATNPLATAPGVVGGAGFYRIINSDFLYYPRRRYVVNVTQAVNAQVSVSIPHGLTPGQKVRFIIPTVAGMTQLNRNIISAVKDGSATILTVIDDYNFTIDVNTLSYTPFTWPTVSQQPSNFPEVVPFGENTAVALLATGAQTPTIAGVQIFNANTGILADSTVNTAYLGMILGIGGIGNELTTAITGPAGVITNVGGVQTPDTIYWVAGKSSYGGQ